MIRGGGEGDIVVRDVRSDQGKAGEDGIRLVLSKRCHADLAVLCLDKRDDKPEEFEVGKVCIDEFWSALPWKLDCALCVLSCNCFVEVERNQLDLAYKYNSNTVATNATAKRTF